VNNQELITLFIEKIKAEDGLSINTALSYQKDLELFAIFLTTNNHNNFFITTQIIRNYFTYLDQQGLASSSISRKISCLKNFYKFLLQEKFINSNPAFELERPKKTKKIPKFLSEEEIFKMLEIVNSDQSEFGIKLSTMLELMYSSGLRVSELVSLKISDLNFENNQLKNYLLVKGKGGKERIIGLNKATLKILNKYLLYRQAIGLDQCKWLFAGNFRSSKSKKVDEIAKKKSLAQNHITRQRFHSMLKELAIKAQIEPSRVHPHVIRHSFASHLLNNGIDLRLLQELLGHSDIATTEIYTHIMNNKLKQVLEENHPLSLLKI
jgi:integrase/recombinase XerD